MSLVSIYVTEDKNSNEKGQYSWITKNVWFSLLLLAALIILQEVFIQLFIYMQVFEWFSITDVIVFENKLSVDSVKYRIEDDDKDKELTQFNKRESIIRIFFISNCIGIIAIQIVFAHRYASWVFENLYGKDINFDIFALALSLTYVITGGKPSTYIVYKTFSDLPVIIIFLRMIFFMNKYTNY